MGNEVVIKGVNDIEVIEHRIYEVRGMRLRSQIVTSSPEFPICESNTRFAIKNFDRKTNLWSKQNNI